MKKLVAIILTLVLALSLTTALAGEKLSIIATENPHAQILELVKDDLAALGYDLDLTVVSDYVVENPATSDGSVQANFFQHIPYLASYNETVDDANKLVGVVFTHFEPLAIYAGTKANLDEIADGDKIAIPNDPTNGARALRLLAKNGLIQVKAGELVTAKDVTANPKSLKIVELDAAQLPRTLQDVTASVINTNFAVEGGLVPSKDALIREGKDSPYANVVAVRKADADKPWVKALVKACNSPEVKKFVQTQLVPKGIFPAF